MPIEEWTEPIYLLQKGENKRHHFYFQRKKDEKLSLYQLEQQLTEDYHRIISKSYKNPKDLRRELKTCFDDYDVKKFLKSYDFENQTVKNYDPEYIPISQIQLGLWSMEDGWESRIYQETRDVQEANSKLKLQIKAANDIKVFKLQEEARLLNLEDLVDGLKDDIWSGTQRQAITKANKDLQDASNRDLGEVKDINQSNINADVNSKNETVTHEIDDDLFEVLNNAFNREREQSI